TSNPESKATNSSLRSRAQASSLRGQVKRPCSKRLAHTHSPLPSQTNTLTRVRWRLVNTNQWPESGSSLSTDWVRAKSWLKPARKSTGAVATKTRVAVEQLNIGPGVVRAWTRAHRAPGAVSNLRAGTARRPTGSHRAQKAARSK